MSFIRAKAWANKTSLTSSRFIEVPVPSKKSARSCICVLGVLILFSLHHFSIGFLNCSYSVLLLGSHFIPNLHMVRVMEFNATFNNISVISWWSVLLVEKSRVSEENRHAADHWQALSHNIVSSTPRLSGIWTENVSDCIGSCQSNYHTITTTTTTIITGEYYL
jgi:hypothetical protein